MKSLEEISKIEIEENWEEAIFELEKRIEVFSLEKKTILRLMFLYWYIVIEDPCVKHNLDIKILEVKFKKLFNNTYNYFKNDPEYLFVNGYMIHFYEMTIDDFIEGYSTMLDKSFGEELMKKAIELSSEKPFNYSENDDGYLGRYFSSVRYQIYY